ncbi:regulatory protein, tetR family [Nonomuraea solani]|uniref:Regulatory protein, tetR family n=1 Tax=Nonomuraea solani TaxID=1144553 RepID=A0A1H6EWQ3_9ACTN|nr:TetR/AcrR family transcriptional regulator C-terminal domain-containing protein [Nonomuraea solani]SEH02340.1 regulatory protein, tetR family [Nonomuraea solani]
MSNVWSRPPKAPRQTLTLDRIVQEALALLDEEGVSRLTMRRLAERLNTGSTTLYWHVKTKDDVLDLALDAVFREVRLPTSPEPPQPTETTASAMSQTEGAAGSAAPANDSAGTALHRFAPAPHRTPPSQPGPQPGSQPGSPSGPQPGSQPGSQPNLHLGAQSGSYPALASSAAAGRGHVHVPTDGWRTHVDGATADWQADADGVNGGGQVDADGRADGRQAQVHGGAGDWQAQVRGLMRGWRAALLRHPWSATILDRPLMGPNALARTEFLYETLTAAGFTAPKAAAFSLSNYVMGSVIMQVTWEDREESDTGTFLRDRADRYPALAEHGLDHEWDATFDDGLGYLLDGMELARKK